MPTNDAGRLKVLEYLENEGITKTHIATLYGLNRQDVGNYLNGRIKNKQANLLITRIIKDYGIS